MQYIHSLRDLNLKNADNESVQIVRDLRARVSRPIVESELQKHFSKYVISQNDFDALKKAIELLQPVEEELTAIYTTKHETDLENTEKEIFQLENVERGITIVKRMPESLNNELEYLKEMIELQHSCIPELTKVFNNMTTANYEDKLAMNNYINDLLSKMLRSKEFVYNSDRIVSEAHIEHIKALDDVMKQGFMFRFTVEEHLKKLDFEHIKRRLPSTELSRMERIQHRVEMIKDGIEKAYQANLKMVFSAVLIYSFIKWIQKDTL